MKSILLLVSMLTFLVVGAQTAYAFDNDVGYEKVYESSEAINLKVNSLTVVTPITKTFVLTHQEDSLRIDVSGLPMYAMTSTSQPIYSDQNICRTSNELTQNLYTISHETPFSWYGTNYYRTSTFAGLYTITTNPIPYALITTHFGTNYFSIS